MYFVDQSGYVYVRLTFDIIHSLAVCGRLASLPDSPIIDDVLVRDGGLERRQMSEGMSEADRKLWEMGYLRGAGSSGS